MQNDKIQLAAMGEHMAEQASQPLCMAKRIEELDSKYKAAMDVVRDLVELPYSTGGLMERLEVRERARDLLAGQVQTPGVQKWYEPIRYEVPEGWQLVPVEPTEEMLDAGYFTNHGANSGIYRAMLAAAPKPETK